MVLWNEKDLPQPPIITYRTTSQNIDLQHLSNVCKEIISFLEQNDHLRIEYAILCRIVYRMKMKFRSAKDFKAVEKVKKALDNFFQIKLAKIVENFLELIPARYKKENYLPTKNLLDFILIRMQGIVKLFERIVETCKIAAHLLTERLHIGHFWRVAFIIFALVSRIFVLAKYTTRKICEFYGKLRPFSELLKNTGKNLLPDSYSLPKGLNVWLNVDWLEYDDDVQIVDETVRLPHIWDFMDLVDDDIEFCDEYYLIDDEEDDDEVKLVKDWKKQQIRRQKAAEEVIDLEKTMHQVSMLKPTSIMRGFDQEDIGEIISIDDTVVSIPDESIVATEAVDESVELVSCENENKKSNEEAKLPVEVSDESVMFVKEFKKKLKRKKLLKNVSNELLEVIGDVKVNGKDSPRKKKKKIFTQAQSDDTKVNKVKKVKKNKKKKLKQIHASLGESSKEKITNINRDKIQKIPHVNVVSPTAILKEKKGSNHQSMSEQSKKNIEIIPNKRKFNDDSGGKRFSNKLSPKKSKKKRLKKMKNKNKS